MRGDRTRRVLAVLGSMVFFFAAPGTVVALVPWWMSRWRIQATFPASSVLRFVGAILVITGYSRPNGFVRAVRPSGFGHAGPRFPATSPCGHRLIPLCSQPHVPRRRIGHRRAGLVLLPLRAPRVRSARRDHRSPLCRWLRGTKIAGDLWGRVRGILRQRTSMASSPTPVGSASVEWAAIAASSSRFFGGMWVAPACMHKLVSRILPPPWSERVRLQPRDRAARRLSPRSRGGFGRPPPPPRRRG